MINWWLGKILQIAKATDVDRLTFLSLFSRHWDHFVPEKRNTLFAVTLEKENGKYELKNKPRNLLKGTGLVSVTKKTRKDDAN